ncbi:DUF3823 domain-containing protein [Massilibacteroides sp.]|uniref:DUF3823 domain-containing protein n=1 Tax=Massilibacteroides sp. TaxID=2034766 RepID=UPI00260A7531|nr:DUF3823 domain-containing protein [Massilibacteroides sp.]MDD4514206.1 DUF3823 domain-containing protein [Massilibacteroides sp.]
MKTINLILFSFIIGFTSCLNDIDNYDAPNGGVSGSILDSETNTPIPLPVSGSTGVIINLYEQNTDATKSIDFYAKAEGIYENSKVFNGEYKIVVNGPFIMPCESNLKINGQTKLDLVATPYSRISATASISGTTVSISYKVVPTNSSYKVTSIFGLWNFAPGVDNGQANQAGKKTGENLEGTIVFNLADDNNYKSNLYKIQSNGNKVYVRMGATINNVVNYSPILEVTLQ